MYIHRIITKGVPGLPDQDLTFWDEWRNEPLHSILITGPNGSGKTTLLRVIAGLWDCFSFWLRGDSAGLNARIGPESARLQALGIKSVLDEIEFAGIQIRDLFEEPIWLWVAYENSLLPVAYQNFINPDELHVGEIFKKREVAQMYPFSLLQRSDELSQWLITLRNQYERLTLGAVGREQSLPNTLYLPTESRHIFGVHHVNNKIKPEILYQWLHIYQGTSDWDQHIEGMLRNLKVRDPSWFYDTLKRINAFLNTSGKSIQDFDNSLRLKVKIKSNGQMHGLDALSSGEQQFVILTFMVSRWLMEGGVMLIDEPDLYMHVTMQRYFIRRLQEMVREKKGQLIVTSHSPEFWRNFTSDQMFTLNPAAVYAETTD